MGLGADWGRVGIGLKGGGWKAVRRGRSSLGFGVLGFGFLVSGFEFWVDLGGGEVNRAPL